MLLGKVTFLDIAVYLVFLSWELLQQVGFCAVVGEAINALSFLVTELPLRLIKERYLTPPKHRLAWTQRSSIFQDVVIRCMRFAFVNMDPRVARVFLSKGVALPFLHFRIWRHAPRVTDQITWTEIGGKGFKAILISWAQSPKPDMLLYYIHGGGFSMGSPYFYLEFLIAVTEHLKSSGFKNPAILALEYTLVPDAVYPTQLKQTIAGYHYACSLIGRERLCVGGDSAGGTLVLSLLLYLARYNPETVPAFACLLSPWTTLVSNRSNTASDYLDNDALNRLGRAYAGDASTDDSIISPGCCRDISWWKKAMPEKGFLCVYGTEEILYDEICSLIGILERVGDVIRLEEKAIHVWPIAVIFLGTEVGERHRSLDSIARVIHQRLIARE